MNPYPTLSGETLVVPILGDPIAQVKSPDGVTRILAARGATPSSSPCTWPPADLDAFIGGLSLAQLGRADRDVPHKFGLVAHCATLTDRAALPRLGQRRPPQPRRHLARRPGGRRSRSSAPPSRPARVPEGATALQVGAGGAGSAIALALLDAGVAELALHDADAGAGTRWSAGCASASATA